MRVALQQWEGRTLTQVTGARVSLLYNVHACKPCMQYLEHTCEYKHECQSENMLITIVVPNALFVHYLDLNF